jgi:septal ring factor EnvC (AmiA/AmiB activator)
MSTLAWTLVFAVTLVALVALATQALVMRAVHRRALARQHTKHQQHQQMLNGQFEQTRKQISQLQSDLATARRDLRQLSKKGTAAPVQRDPAAVRQSLEREIDAASASRRPLPADGFAETQPSLEVTQYGSLLIQ